MKVKLVCWQFEFGSHIGVSDTSNVHWMSQLLSLNYGDFKNVSLRVEKIQKDFLWGQEVLRKNTISQLVYNLQTQEKNGKINNLPCVIFY